MQAVDGTQAITSASVQENKKTHVLHLCGKLLGDIKIMARAQLQSIDDGTTVLKLAVRSNDKSLSQQISECIR
jgi:hypothetical protein